MDSILAVHSTLTLVYSTKGVGLLMSGAMHCSPKCISGTCIILLTTNVTTINLILKNECISFLTIISDEAKLILTWSGMHASSMETKKKKKKKDKKRKEKKSLLFI